MGARAAHLAAQGDADGARAALTQATASIDGLDERLTEPAVRDHFARAARQRLPSV